ncbi:hypothetical protein [Dactylosporangium sp. CA-233914]
MNTPAEADTADQVGSYESVTAATLALGSKTYTGTVAGGGGDTAPPVHAE